MPNREKKFCQSSRPRFPSPNDKTLRPIFQNLPTTSRAMFWKKARLATLLYQHEENMPKTIYRASCAFPNDLFNIAVTTRSK